MVKVRKGMRCAGKIAMFERGKAKGEITYAFAQNVTRNTVSRDFLAWSID